MFRFEGKYQIVFASHCSEYLPVNTRTVQVAILIALKLYVEKLILINSTCSKDDTVEKMEVDDVVVNKSVSELEQIITHIINVLDYSLGTVSYSIF